MANAHDESVFIIAEAGVNHNGSLEIALRLVDAAYEAGADAVKFQTFKADKLVTRSAEKAAYQQKNTDASESQFAMLKRLELSVDAHHRIRNHCDGRGIAFMSTAFDTESLTFLVNEMGVKTLKIPSGEITNGPLLLAHAQTGCNLILSTGMATLAEIETALGVIAFGLLDCIEKPSRGAFKRAFLSHDGQRFLKDRVTLLHCTTEYPAPLKDINLRAMETMKNAFGLPVGYSDHSEGITVPIAATAMGAVMIEKHFTLDKNHEGPDHKASLEPDELGAMVAAVRAVGIAMGDGIKEPKGAEIRNLPVARKSLCAATDIRKGVLFTAENLTVKRPGNGIEPMQYWALLGKPSLRDYAADEMISE